MMAEYENHLLRLGLSSNIKLKTKQVEVLKLLEAKNLEILAILPTGYGKSLIYQLAPLILDGTVVVFSPLSVIQEEQIQKLRTSGLKCCILNTRSRLMLPSYQQGRILTADTDEDVKDLKCDIDIAEVSNCSLIFAHPEAFFCTSEGKDLLDSFRGKSFRKAFQHMRELPGFFPGVPRLGLSATITTKDEADVIASLGMTNPAVVRASPDRENIYLQIKVKEPSLDIYDCYENLYKPICNDLLKNPDIFPVTLFFMPLQYIGNAATYCNFIFERPTLDTCLYGILCSGQDDEVKNHVIKELSCEKPKIKLVFCTSVVGMGFNSPSIERVIHARPPRSLSDYIQEIGRAGRTGKDSTALLHYCNRDVAANVKDIKDDIIGFCKEKGCLREYILKQYGFQKSEIDLHHCCNNCRPHCLCIECQMLRIDI
ncbi:ATP-dependent DNA helicase RecQ [Mytilus galloprovincialis]|uniref:DNA 3'-5' helicase n=1 Tax=Mytilus galloprovincialis TaxID=29158 RepID=A0A8B6HIV0_MYTGA|nr:ATP-dependent DNA helicase RecQ [Mytilus galloprovincialis]